MEKGKLIEAFIDTLLMIACWFGSDFLCKHLFHSTEFKEQLFAFAISYVVLFALKGFVKYQINNRS